MGSEHDGPVPSAGAASGTGDPLLPDSAPILLVDAHELVGWSLTLSLREAGEPASFCPARRVADLADTARRVGPGLLVLELRLGCDADGHRIDGLALITAMTGRGWRAIVLTGTASPGEVGAALDAGAFGWIPKTLPFPQLLAALRAARAGRPITSADQRHELVAQSRRQAFEHERHVTALDSLTRRELDVLTDLAAGRRPQVIATRCSVSPHTVRAQIRSVLTKLDVRSQLEAVALFHEVASRPDGWDRIHLR